MSIPLFLVSPRARAESADNASDDGPCDWSAWPSHGRRSACPPRGQQPAGEQRGARGLRAGEPATGLVASAHLERDAAWFARGAAGARPLAVLAGRLALGRRARRRRRGCDITRGMCGGCCAIRSSHSMSVPKAAFRGTGAADALGHRFPLVGANTKRSSIATVWRHKELARYRPDSSLTRTGRVVAMVPAGSAGRKGSVSYALTQARSLSWRDQATPSSPAGGGVARQPPNGYPIPPRP
jgi:hypothetical protein